ncbi:hypothetical protein [Microvirga brassicacearum]|uniref:Uncharacterized protein n=1 Tax=Microvirga brassicacearum TaxID=2580413 RepID=A0A5N3P5Q3_9HYPH|nr:hypothetical protein [Microvirga brassicacearum]KAB0264981.1 hypothetical protein FEZ63_20635 [Microvirga brassicacearum]
MTTLTVREAYLAMYRFMEVIADRDNLDGFNVMLGSMSFLRDGSTADAGMWWDWEQAVKRVEGDLDSKLSIEEAHATMRSFLETYNSRGPSDDIIEILIHMVPPSLSEPEGEPLWKDWLNAVRAAKMNEVDAALRLHKLR